MNCTTEWNDKATITLFRLFKSNGQIKKKWTSCQLSFNSFAREAFNFLRTLKLKFGSDSHRMLMHLNSRLESRSQLSLSSWTWSRPTLVEYCERIKRKKIRRRQPASSKHQSRTVDFVVNWYILEDGKVKSHFQV